MPFDKVEASQLSELEPHLRSLDTAAAYFPSIAQIRNPRLMKSLVMSCQSLGVQLWDQCTVSGFIQENQTINGVETDHGPVEADAVLVAGGAWSGALLTQLGIDMPVKPIRGQMLIFRTEPDAIRHVVLSNHHYVIPRRDGRVLVGSTLEDVGFDKATTETARQQLVDFAVDLFPFLSKMPIEHHWSGLRPASPGGVPYISEVPNYSGLFVNCGHFRNGVVLGLASAQLARDLILHREPILEPAPYGFSRANPD